MRNVIFFDWDGTLARKEVAEEAAFRRCKTLGMKVTRKSIREDQKTHAHYEKARKAIEEYTGITDKSIKTSIMTDLYRFHYTAVANEQKEKIFYPNIIKVLEKIKQKHPKIQFVIISTLRHDLINSALELSGYKNLFAAAFGNTPDLIYSKSELAEMAAEQFGKPLLVVGDRAEDLAAAKQFNAKSCFCTWGHGSNENVKADFVVGKPEELTGILGSLI